jgi:crotonobetainyl-CoA:carnitine CoA-transferase CaiB-like acyl-CoA transferase
MVLADAGAQVISRTAGGRRALRPHPGWALVWNRGRRHRRRPAHVPGRAELTDMAAVADIVIDGFSPGTCARWGSAPTS